MQSSSGCKQSEKMKNPTVRTSQLNVCCGTTLRHKRIKFTNCHLIKKRSLSP